MAPPSLKGVVIVTVSISHMFGRAVNCSEFLPRDATQSALLLYGNVFPSVRLFVTLRYRDHIGWNISTRISRDVRSLQTPISRIYSIENTLKHQLSSFTVL